MYISYRKEYRAHVVMEAKNLHTLEFSVEFSIEMTPLGQKEVRVIVPDSVNYPVIPILRALKPYIHDLERDGHLP
jgi:hypothetical protein